MAMFGDDQGKTEKATPGRLAESRQKGDTPLSRELVQAGVMMTAAIMIWVLGGWLVESFAAVMRQGFTLGIGRSVDQIPFAEQEVLGAFECVIWPFATLVTTVVIATLVLGYGQIGFKYSGGVLGFKLEKLNPVANCVSNPAKLRSNLSGKTIKKA